MARKRTLPCPNLNLLPSFYPAATLLDETLFSLGVSSGSATDSSIHLSAVLAGDGPWRLVVLVTEKESESVKSSWRDR